MAKQFESMADLQEYADSQFAVIVNQNKKIAELSAELAHLKSLLNSSVPVLTMDSTININDEELIARSQLEKLRGASMNRELTLEEARKLEIYSKIINQIENRPKKNVLPTQKLSNDELIAAVQIKDE